MGLGTFVRLARYRLRTSVSHVPAIYMPLARLKMRARDAEGPAVVESDTNLVIEAFPRSGNSFAVTAFRFAQRQPIRLAHHFHAAAQIIRGVRLDKPVLLIVRHPKDAVLSFVLREEHVPLEVGLGSWIDFHRRLLPYANRLVVASFERVTSDFGTVVDDVNRRFGTSFSRFEHTEENVRACFELIEKRNAMRFGGGSVLESFVARPSSARNLLKPALEEKWQALPKSRQDEAFDLYASFKKLESVHAMRGGDGGCQDASGAKSGFADRRSPA
ncbi:MAG TPA: hypothetical protein VK753_08170 [Xanthomonadaceae bacterium]|jgi:hypothetical protein|nr:hypothetical protein [Xanthomonadaceae bacterium]